MNYNEKEYLKRLVDKNIERYLEIFGAISVEGPKWCGKTWTASNHAKSFRYLDDENTKELALLDINLILNDDKKSLLILDEIGRGTSTFDGLSIAWAVVEYISNKEKIGARTLFATHYHELTELEDKIDGVKNYCIAVKEKGEDVIFLRKIIRGGADESYGVHVAKLAGVPNAVTSRANQILKKLKEDSVINKSETKKQTNVSGQFDLFNYKLGEIAAELDKINLNELTPIDALNILSKMKQKL